MKIETVKRKLDEMTDEQLMELDDKLFQKITKVKMMYCKYCYKTVYVVMEGDIFRCEKCNSGLSTFELETEYNLSNKQLIEWEYLRELGF